MKYLITALILLMPWIGSSQTYKVPVKGNFKLVILNLNGMVTVNGQSTESLTIIRMTTRQKVEMPDSDGVEYPEDNTGIGLNIIQDGPVITIQPANRQAEWQDFVFTLPKNSLIRISNYEANTFLNQDISSKQDSIKGIHIENLSGEIEVYTWHSPVYLDSITGPASVHTVNGNIRADYYDLSQKGIHSYESVRGDIWLTVPKNSNYRQILTNSPDLRKKRPKRHKPGTNKNSIKIMTGSVKGYIDLSEKNKQ